MVNNKNSGRVVFAHITVGLQLAITMFIFVYGGHRLDLHFNKSPLFLIIGTILGMSLGFYHLFKDLQDDGKNSNMNAEDKENKKRIKWN